MTNTPTEPPPPNPFQQLADLMAADQASRLAGSGLQDVLDAQHPPTTSQPQTETENQGE